MAQGKPDDGQDDSQGIASPTTSRIRFGVAVAMWLAA
jgi:hypothetical protein